MATAYHCVDIEERCDYKWKKKCKDNMSKEKCKENVKHWCRNVGLKTYVSADPPRLCDPSNGKLYVTMGAHYTHKFKRHHKRSIKEIHAPSKQGNKHDFAIMVLDTPVPDILEEWKQGVYMLCIYGELPR